MLQRVKEVQESDLRMLGNLARNIQRVLPVTQADIDAAAALGQGWVVWKVIEVNDPIDNLRGGTQLVIKQNSITPGQNVRRVLIVQGPGGETVVIGPGPSPLLLPDAIANSLSYVKAFGGTEQNGTPTPDTPMDIVSNNGVLKANTNLYWTEYNSYELSQVDGITLKGNSGVNVSGMVDCRTIKSFKITTASPQGSFRIFKYRADNTYIDANSTASIGDIITLEDNVGFFRIQYNFTNSGTGTENVLIYNSAYDLNSIYADGTVETINVHGKNFFDASPFNTDVGQNISWLHYRVPNGTYTMSTNFPPQTGQVYTNVWVLAGNVTSGQDSAINGVSLGNPKTITVTDGWYSVAYRSGIPAIPQNPKDYNWQLEKGSTATTYEPYFNGGTATTEMLLKVGDYEDVQEILSGAVTRNVGIIVFDGTEDWRLSTNQLRFYLAFTGCKTGSGDVRIPSLCSHLADSNQAPAVMTTGYGVWTTSSVPYIQVSINNFSFSTVNDFKQFLSDQYAAGTPVIIVYPLETPTTESVAGQTLQVQAGNNIVEITQASIDDLEIEAEYQKA